MNTDKIILGPKEVQNLLDCIDTGKIFVCDCGKDGWDYGEELEITDNE